MKKVTEVAINFEALFSYQNIIRMIYSMIPHQLFIFKKERRCVGSSILRGTSRVAVTAASLFLTAAGNAQTSAPLPPKTQTAGAEATNAGIIVAKPGAATDRFPDYVKPDKTPEKTITIPAATGADAANSLPADAEAKVSARATARWNAIAEGKYDVAFSYFSLPSQTAYSPELLRDHWSKFAPKSANMKQIDCDGQICTLLVLVDGAIRLPRVGLTQQFIPSTERWLWDGITFYLLRK